MIRGLTKKSKNMRHWSSSDWNFFPDWRTESFFVSHTNRECNGVWTDGWNLDEAKNRANDLFKTCTISIQPWRINWCKATLHECYVYNRQLVNDKSTANCQLVKATISPPERCDFTSSQQYNNNVLWSLLESLRCDVFVNTDVDRKWIKPL